MVPPERWLSLKVSEKTTPSQRSRREVIRLIAVPKKVVRLATGRNRVKRLIREVLRNDAFFTDATKIYCFRVSGLPSHLDLIEVRRAVEDLK